MSTGSDRKIRISNEYPHCNSPWTWFSACVIQFYKLHDTSRKSSPRRVAMRIFIWYSDFSIRTCWHIYKVTFLSQSLRHPRAHHDRHAKLKFLPWRYPHSLRWVSFLYTGLDRLFSMSYHVLGFSAHSYVRLSAKSIDGPDFVVPHVPVAHVRRSPHFTSHCWVPRHVLVNIRNR